MRAFKPVFLLAAFCLFFTILTASAQDPWADFKFPIINFIDQDNGSTEGAKIYHKIIPEPETYMKEVCRDVCRLFYNSADEVRNFNKLNYYLKYYDGISGKWGSPPEISIQFSTKYIQEYYSSNNNNDIKMESEIIGVLFHEMTHGYQYEPKNCGNYQSGTEFFGFIEGLADGDRIRAGYHQNRKPNSSGSKWKAGYTTTGFFYNWVVNNYDQNFLAKLNETCISMDPWSFDKACKAILNKGAEELWNEYAQKLSDIGTKPVVDFSADNTTINGGETVTFANTTTNAETYDWTFDGGTPRKSYDEIPPPIQYSKPGTYKVILVAHNKNPIGPGIEVKREYIEVGPTYIATTDKCQTTTFALTNYPNPCIEATAISFNLSEQGNTALTIYDLNGKKIKTVLHGNIPEGAHRIAWHRQNEYGKKVSPGIYIYRLTHNGRMQTERMIVSGAR